MKFISTRNNAPALSFQEVVLQGLAVDGGLYVPEFLPKFSQSELEELRQLDYSELFFAVTRHFVGKEIDDLSYKNIIKKSYQNFSHSAIAPLKQLDSNHFLLELFHGPTLAFKDFALQFLGNLLDHFLQQKNQRIVIIGATSGDTGSAAIWGCKSCQMAEIFIMHPHKKVSDVQRRQMTTVLDKNVYNLAIEGNFDDCQSMVKKMFAAESSNDSAQNNFLKGKKMVAVNSINFARIMAQIVYYFYSALRLGCSESKPISFSVPSGNFGDIYAGFLAKKMGLNIGKLIIATNSNDILQRFINNNDYRKSDMIETISPSMNIQVSSNFERLLFDAHKTFNRQEIMAELMAEFERSGQLKVASEILNEIRKDFTAFSVDDATTSKVILDYYHKTSEILDPHTAIGVHAADKFIASSEYKNEIVVTLATAHAAKFPDAVVKAGAPNPSLPRFLSNLFELEEKFEIMPNNLAEVQNFISNKV